MNKFNWIWIANVVSAVQTVRTQQHHRLSSEWRKKLWFFVWWNCTMNVKSCSILSFNDKNSPLAFYHVQRSAVTSFPCGYHLTLLRTASHIHSVQQSLVYFRISCALVFYSFIHTFWTLNFNDERAVIHSRRRAEERGKCKCYNFVWDRCSIVIYLAYFFLLSSQSHKIVFHSSVRSTHFFPLNSRRKIKYI